MADTPYRVYGILGEPDSREGEQSLVAKSGVGVVDGALETLVRVALAISERGLPDDVEDRATQIFIDSVACGIGGWGCPMASAMDRVIPRDREDGPAVMLGSPVRAAADLAACWNTSLIRYLDFNDLTSSGHPSDMVGAVIAVGTATQASGRDMLTGLVIAYEVFGRLAERVLRTNKTLDQGYAIAAGTAAMTASLLGAGPEAIRHAISLAATASVPLRATRAGQLSHYKGGATAVAVRDGVFLAQLAVAGLTGPEAPFEGRHGIVELLDGEAGPLVLEEDSRWFTLECCLKYFPMAYNMQTSVWAALQLREMLPELHRNPDGVKDVLLRATPFSWHESASEPEKWDPRSRETADHSIPYVFAHAFRFGSVNSSAYEAGHYRDPETLRLMQRIRVEPDWSRGGIESGLMGVDAELTDSSGETHHVSIGDPLGHFRNPLRRDDVESKALGLMVPRLGDPRARVALARMWRLRELDTSGVLELLEGLIVESQDGTSTRGLTPIDDV